MQPTAEQQSGAIKKGRLLKMLKNIIPRERKFETSYMLAYDDGHWNGYMFDCDEHGIPLDSLTDTALKMLESCKTHPEKFARAGEIVSFDRSYVEPAHGTCECGEVVTLENQYLGACECTKCGRWYNLFGESLLPPDQWELCEDDMLDEEIL